MNTLAPGDIEWTDEIEYKFCSNTPQIFGKCFLEYFNYELVVSFVMFWGGISIATSWYVWSNYDYVVATAKYYYDFSMTTIKCSWIGLFTDECEKKIDKFE